MFESLGYTERTLSKRQMMALPMAAAIQLTLGAAYMIHYVYSPETLAPPSVWISAYPAIPVTLRSPPVQRLRRDQAPVKPLRQTGLVEPDTKDPALPPPSDSLSGPSDVGAEDPRELQGVDGLLPDTDITGFVGETQDRNTGAPTILQQSDVTPPKLLQQVAPAYPAAALAMRLGGKVLLQVVVNEEGRVVDVQVLTTTNVMFNQAALDAVRRWRYTPPLAKAGGQAVACYLTVAISFEPR